MSEHGVPIGPGPWQPTPAFFSSLLAGLQPRRTIAVKWKSARLLRAQQLAEAVVVHHA